ncbi:MAG: hypothetical protein KBH21_07225 [Acetoanaerobium sp.]|nr:hypothetical protein [Acetoanaerobium sp.]
MPNVRKSDYEKIIKIFNESGDRSAMEYIQEHYGIKAPRGVIMRIKKSPGYSYDAENKKILVSNDTDGSIFMGMEELCNKGTSNALKSSVVSTTNNDTLESLYKELMLEKLLELNKYVNLNRCICQSKIPLYSN